MNPGVDTQLVYAANSGDIKSVKRALLAGADIHADGDKALRWASDTGHKEVVVLLLKSGADIHANHDYALRISANNNHLEVVDLLLKSGANIHAQDDCALLWAAENGRWAVVDLLLKSGADVHAKNDYALLRTLKHGHLEVVDMLLRSGADSTALFQSDITVRQLTRIVKQHAATAFRGAEAVMMLTPTSRLSVLRHLHPELKPKQIREELAMFEVLGLDAAQMGAMWQDRHGTSPQVTNLEVTL